MNTEVQDKNGAISLPATSGPRPFRCEICQRSFQEVITLTKHEQLHRADRPYACQTCGKSFLWSSNLKVHERVHTGERPYKCKICHRSFTQSNDLRRHERNVHMRAKLYTCRAPTGHPVSQPVSTPAHMNLAVYQAFALQQHAMLQQALTYESVMQSSVATTNPHYLHHTGHTQSNKDPCISTSASHTLQYHDNLYEPIISFDKNHTIKLEQVSPTSKCLNLGRSDSNHDDQNKSPHQSDCSPASSKRHSPQSKSVSSYSIISKNVGQLESSIGLRDEHPAFCKSYQSDYPSNSFQSDQSEFLDHQSVLSHHQSVMLDHQLVLSDHQSILPDHRSVLSDHQSELSDNQSVLSDHRSVLPDCRSVTSSELQAVSSLPQSFPLAFSLSPPVENGMDLRINKSTSSGDSEDGELDWKTRHTSVLSSKSSAYESETDSKRNVTTTSYTPTIDSGIHHCPHCDIFFHDFTMFNLHQSLHSPMDKDPFLCPSCHKHCQDRIEFMFHMVWHVVYPHSIPRYQTFKETQLVSEPEQDKDD